MSAIQDLATYLEAQGLAGGSTAWTLIRRRLADEPVDDQLVVLSEDGGSPPEIAATEGIGDSAQEDIGVQLLVRGEPWDGDASAAKAQEIYDAIHGLRSATLGTRTYLRVAARTPEPVWIGFDERGRPRHTMSFLMLAEA